MKTNLEKLKEYEPSDKLQEYVKEYMIENSDDYDDIQQFISDLMKNGCQSGMVGELIYYKDTNEFYDKFEDEIEDLIDEYGSGCGYENRLQTIASLNGADNVGNIMQEKNLLAWFGMERAVNDIADELEIEW